LQEETCDLSSEFQGKWVWGERGEPGPLNFGKVREARGGGRKKFAPQRNEGEPWIWGEVTSQGRERAQAQ